MPAYADLPFDFSGNCNARMHARQSASVRGIAFLHVADRTSAIAINHDVAVGKPAKRHLHHGR